MQDQLVVNAVEQFLSDFVTLETALIRAKNAGSYQISPTPNQADPEGWTVTIKTRTGWTMTLVISNGSAEYVIMRRTEPRKKA